MANRDDVERSARQTQETRGEVTAVAGDEVDGGSLKDAEPDFTDRDRPEKSAARNKSEPVPNHPARKRISMWR